MSQWEVQGMVPLGTMRHLPVPDVGAGRARRQGVTPDTATQQSPECLEWVLGTEKLEAAA